ncbi:MAG: SagB/ThcOx family dehydrogenase [Candidatus Dormibacteria bacterium]
MSENYRLRPELMVYVDEIDDALQICLEVDTRTAPFIANDPIFIWSVLVLPSLFTENSAKQVWEREPTAADLKDQLWKSLLDDNLIVPASPVPQPSFAGYHFATRCHPFLDMSAGYLSFTADNNLMSEYRTQNVAPSPYLDLKYLQVYPLLRATDLSDPLLRVDRAQHLSLLFDGTFGSHAKLPAFSDALWGYTQDELLRKPIPSGGARHPTEVFALIRHHGVPSGLYHYDVRHNALGLLSEYPELHRVGRIAGGLFELITGHDGCESVVLFLVSMVERAMFRYRDSRSFRAIVVDAGHAVGQLAELANYLGFEYWHVAYFNAAEISSLLSLDQWKVPPMACGVIRR